jgi:hypothetical protein
MTRWEGPQPKVARSRAGIVPETVRRCALPDRSLHDSKGSRLGAFPGFRPSLADPLPTAQTPWPNQQAWATQRECDGRPETCFWHLPGRAPSGRRCSGFRGGACATPPFLMPGPHTHLTDASSRAESFSCRGRYTALPSQHGPARGHCSNDCELRLLRARAQSALVLCALPPSHRSTDLPGGIVRTI